MEKDKQIPEHKRYSARLTEIEKRCQENAKASRPAERIGHKVRGIKFYRYFANGERVLKLVLLFGSILLLMLYIISPLSKIQEVTVSGNHELSDAAVESATQVHPGRYMWGIVFAQKTVSQRAHQRNPQVKAVTFKVTGAQALQINVQENPVVGIVELGQHDYNVLANGQLQSAQVDKSEIRYQHFAHHRQELKKTAIQISKLKTVIRDGISTISYEPTKTAPNRLVIYMRDGNTVYANLNTVGKKMGYYPAIAASMKETGVIDLQVGAYSYAYGSHDK